MEDIASEKDAQAGSPGIFDLIDQIEEIVDNISSG